MCTNLGNTFQEQRTPVDPSEQNGHDNRLSKESSGSEEVEAAPREVEPVKTQRRSSRRPETNLREKKPSGAMHAAGDSWITVIDL